MYKGGKKMRRRDGGGKSILSVGVRVSVEKSGLGGVGLRIVSGDYSLKQGRCG